MQIIKCTEADWEAAAEFYDKVTAYLEQHRNYPKWTHGGYPGKESTGQAIRNGVQYLCLDGEQAAGAFILNEDPMGDYSAGDWSVSLPEGSYLVIHTLAADPERYHRGIGKFMVAYCIETAKEKGYSALRLDVVPSNLPAKRLYEAMEFRFAGTRDLKRDIPEIPVFDLYERNL